MIEPDGKTGVGQAGSAPDVALILLNNSGIGGTERRFAQVYRGLRARGVSVSLVINESLQQRLVRSGLLEPDEAALVVKEPVGKVAHTWRKADYGLACVSVGWWLLKTKPKVMHLVLGGAYVALPAQALGWAPPAVLSVVCPSLRDMVGSASGLWLYRRALKRAALVDALTESVGAVVKSEGVAPERIRVSFGSCVDTHRFRPAQAKKPWVVFSGRLIDEKNPLLFVEACARVHRLVPEARFFLLGNGPLRRPVEESIRRHKLDACTDVGWRDEVQEILGPALLFASLQRMDNYPSQALLEAMACGASVVATDVGLTGKLVDDTVGLRVPADPVSVAEALVRLLADPERTQILGERGRERVLREHSLDAYLTHLEGLYAAAGESGAQPAYASAEARR
ncbi:MAG: glycosyltransferase [Nitrospirota bacterium]|nr:glycosyltransferase [Nitrospirota bacterium]